MKINFKINNLNRYVKLALMAVLASISVVVCMQGASSLNTAFFLGVTACCCALIIFIALDTYVIKKFAVKMVFYAVEVSLLMTICVLSGNAYLSTLYCIMLTQFYINLEKFRDKTVLFGVSCGLFLVSYITGFIISNPEVDLYTIIVGSLGGMFFGLLAMAIDYVVVLFLQQYAKTNGELEKSLKETEESKARLEMAYGELTQAKIYEERNRIAKDIHDNAGHSMTTVIMQTEAAKLLIDENPAEAKNRIISANIHARNALEQMRESVHLLAGRTQTRPLNEELEEIIAQTIDGTEIKARCDIGAVNAGEEVYRYICNTVKESMANGIRHGSATAFYIELKEEEGKINLYVSDNGSGAEGNLCEGFGLRGMREKAETLGGICKFTSEEGEGFEVEITLPAKGGKSD